MFFVCVVSSEPPSRVVTPLQSATTVDMSYYNKLLSHVPEDRTTVGLMLHCMIEQVCIQSLLYVTRSAKISHIPAQNLLHFFTIAYILALLVLQKLPRMHRNL